MGKTREFSSIAGTERPGRGEKLKRHARGLGALALSVAVAIGLYHEAHKPAINDEQMRDMTNNVRAVVLNEAEEIREDGSREGDSYTTGEDELLGAVDPVEEAGHGAEAVVDRDVETGGVLQLLEDRVGHAGGELVEGQC